MISDKEFLEFFFKRLRRNETGRYEDHFPYVSLCGRERNFIRCGDLPIVFTHLTPSQRDPSQSLFCYCNGGLKLSVPFLPEKLCMLPNNGRVYYASGEIFEGVGLVSSTLAIELSAHFEYEAGSPQSTPPTHINWQSERYRLTNEALRLIKAAV